MLRPRQSSPSSSAPSSIGALPRQISLSNLQLSTFNSRSLPHGTRITGHGSLFRPFSPLVTRHSPLFRTQTEHTRHTRVEITPMPSCACPHFPSHQGVAALTWPPSHPPRLSAGYLSCFQLLAHSLARRKPLSPVLSMLSVLFARKHPGVGGYPPFPSSSLTLTIPRRCFWSAPARTELGHGNIGA